MPFPSVRLHLWPERYVVARLACVPDLATRPAASPPVSLVVGHDEISLVAPEDVVAALGASATEVSPGWRALTLDVVMPHGLVGVLAAVADALARIALPVMVFSSFDTDHFLVPETALGRALAAINQIDLERLLSH